MAQAMKRDAPAIAHALTPALSRKRERGRPFAREAGEGGRRSRPGEGSHANLRNEARMAQAMKRDAPR